MRRSLWRYSFPLFAVFLTGNTETYEETYEETSEETSEERPPGDIRNKIFSSLERIKTPEAFGYGVINTLLPNPGLHLAAYGTLGLPLSSKDAKKIISEAHKAPFGKGEKTLVDTTVRKTWELNPNQFQLKNRVWKKTVEKIAENVTTGLGFDKQTLSVSAELYKLLLYEPGSFFKPHRDSEKAPGMFATLVVCLPSPHKGGKLVGTHSNKSFEFDTATSSKFDYSYAAWYSDVTHEVQPVESGYRLVLTYNLIRKAGSETPSYDHIKGRVNELSSLLKEYDSYLKAGNDTLPRFLLHKLEHKYTQANLKLDSLKPPDLGQVQMLKELSAKLGFGIYLAIFELFRNFIEEDDYDEYRDGMEKLLEVFELHGKLVTESISCPRGAVIDPKPQKADQVTSAQVENHGNDGVIAELWYRNAVVVLVPPSRQKEFDSDIKDKTRERDW